MISVRFRFFCRYWQGQLLRRQGGQVLGRFKLTKSHPVMDKLQFQGKVPAVPRELPKGLPAAKDSKTNEALWTNF